MSYNVSNTTTIPDIRPGVKYDHRPAVSIPRTKLTRAKRSCDLCRKKKIRCDADVKKPCTSCANVNVDCKFLVEQKKRGPATGFSTKKNNYVEALESRLKRMEALVANMAADKTTTTTTPGSADTPNPLDSMDYDYYSDDDSTTIPATNTHGSNNNDNDNNDSRSSSFSSNDSNHPLPDDTTTLTGIDTMNEGGYAAAALSPLPPVSTMVSTSITTPQSNTAPAPATATAAATAKGKDKISDPWLIENIQDDLGCRDIFDATTELASKLDKITIADYERTRYIGMSSGVHLLHQGLFSTNKRHRIRELPSWFVQKVNDDQEEHILIKSEALKSPPPQGYLDRTSAFTTLIPHMRQDRLDVLIHTYFTKYHPLCPIVNKMTFLEQYYYQDPSPCDEYLLCAICAICIRTLSILDRFTLPPCMNELTEDEFLEMGNAFQEKAVSIFDYIYRRSRISSVQTLILLTLFVEPPERDSDDTSYWFKTGIAIRMAQDLGLHRSSAGWHIPECELELRRRIWYVTYMMDRWVAAELGRPVTIIDQEFDAELPSVHEVGSCHHKDLSERPFVPDIILQTEMDIQKKTCVYAQFYYSIHLGQIFGQVLSGLHSPRSIQSGRRNHSLVHVLDQRLKNWKLSLPSEMLYDMGDSQQQSANSALLFLGYNCILLLLYRPFIITNQEYDDVNFAFKALSACTVAANNILSVTENMDVFTLSCIPWTISIYSIFQAALIFLHNAKGNNSYVAEQGAKNLHRCSQVIRRDQCLSSTRIAIVLQSIAACFSVNLEEDHLDSSDIQQRRRRKRTNSTTNPTPSTIMPTQEHGSTVTTTTNSPVDTAMYNSEKEPMAKHPRPNLAHQLTDVDDNGTTAPFPSYLQHYKSTRPEDMFLTSLSMANPPAASSPSSSPATQGISMDTSSPYHHQHLPTMQLSLDPLQPQNQDTKKGKMPPYEQQADIWPVEPPIPVQQQQPWQDSEQPSPFQQNQQQPFDVTCLSSEVPLYNMPNSVIWEDWDSFLKSNISQ